jgi:hypothetical protein
VAGKTELERFLERAGLPNEAQFALRALLCHELPKSDVLLSVKCGEKPSLLHVTPAALVFYFIEVAGSQTTRTRVITIRVALPRGARITEERELRGEDILLTTKFLAEHEAFPWTVECDCSLLDEATLAPVRELFQSWAEPDSAGS